MKSILLNDKAGLFGPVCTKGDIALILLNLLFYELKRLLDDYYKCENAEIRELIHSDIKLLTDAFLLSSENNGR